MFAEIFRNEHYDRGSPFFTSYTHMSRNNEGQKKKINVPLEIQLNLNDIVFGVKKTIQVTEYDQIINIVVDVLPNTKNGSKTFVETTDFTYTGVYKHCIDKNIRIKHNDIYYIHDISLLHLLCGFELKVDVIDVVHTFSSKKCFDYNKHIIIENKGIVLDMNYPKVRGNFIFRFKLDTSEDDIQILAKYHRFFKRILK